MSKDFGHLSVKKRDTAEFTFYAIDGEPTLIVKHSGETNKKYFNEVLRRAEHFQKRKAKISVEMLADARERDRVLYPKHVVTGWKNVVDKDKVVVPYTEDDCEAFLRAIPDEELDGLREFCRDASNFREATIDAAGAAGNSPTA